tara:strand:+ start:266 stop:970 length:705 start_codon:yes stop_codon:yes gene_type:complete
MTQNLQQNRKLVEGVFNKVFDKYDFMNDVMSFGIHRLWKKELIQMMNPSENHSLIDVASGTGDIGKLYSISTNNKSKILCTDSNLKMIKEGKKKLKKFNNINWKICSAENLLAPSNYFDFYTISFGLRNTKDINKSISEAYRVLKKGGRFLCLEFSKVQNQNLETIYNNYSKLIPIVGKIVVGDDKPYKYLIKSINNFVNQENLIKIMEKNKFLNCSYKNLNGGIVAIHSGWKV